MSIKAIITGATGMVGEGVLHVCLNSPDVESVLVLNRKPCGVTHPKLKEIIHKDFMDLTSIEDQLAGYNAGYFCAGVSSIGKKENEYRKITYDLTLNFANSLVQLNPEMVFTYVSGVGTDSTEKGKSMWGRVKGKTENDLLSLGFKQAYMFRPGAIIPLRGIKSRTKSYQFMYDYFMWLVKLIKAISPNSVVSTTQIGLAMINAMLKGYSKKVLRPKEIIDLSNK